MCVGGGVFQDRFYCSRLISVRLSPVPTSASSGSITSLGSATSVDYDQKPAMYMERLKVLRARCGLDNPQSDGNKPAEGSPVTNTEQPAMKHAASVPVKLGGSTSSLSSNSSNGIPGEVRDFNITLVLCIMIMWHLLVSQPEKRK